MARGSGSNRGRLPIRKRVGGPGGRRISNEFNGGRGFVWSRATRPRLLTLTPGLRGRVARDHTFSSASSVLILQAFRRSGLRALSIMIELRMTPPILRPDYREFSRL